MEPKRMGQFIKALRKEKELTQEQLAEALFVSGKTVSRWETGSSLPDLAMLQNIADYFDVDIRELIDGARFAPDAGVTEAPAGKETVQKMAEYSSGKEKRSLRKLWGLFGLIVLAAGCLTAFLYIRKRNKELDREQVRYITGTVTHYDPEEGGAQELVLLCDEVALARIRITADTRMPDALKKKIEAQEKALLLTARAVWTERQQKAAQKEGKEFVYTVDSLEWGGSSVDYYIDRTEWKPLIELREGYTPEQAGRDDCVVLEGSEVLHGELLWQEFLQQTKEGWPGSIRIYQGYFSQGNDYFVKELEFTGEEYHLTFYDRTGDTNEWFLYTNTYHYLKEEHYKEYQRDAMVYMLTDNMDADYGTYISHILSSMVLPYDPRFDNFTVLFSVNAPGTPEFYDGDMADIDGDGVAERCYLGTGDMLSGMCSFSLLVYGRKDGLRYQRIFYTLPMTMQFIWTEDHELCLHGTAHQNSSETHIYRIRIINGKLELEENGEYLKGN